MEPSHGTPQRNAVQQRYGVAWTSEKERINNGLIFLVLFTPESFKKS